MISKVFEIRDEGTHIQAIVIKLSPHDICEYLTLKRVGYGDDLIAQGCHVLLIPLIDGVSRATSNPNYHAGGRTLKHAHLHIIENFDVLLSGSVIDVRFLLGETEEPCESELKL